ncbi:MAG: type II toxin-antitoxin system HicB family antitoxin [Acidobacteriia bacterium]|nr:type II toxin-antitoxin system HicB family antitoxin [Terriglobia bacterium]
MRLTIELDRDVDGRWIAGIEELNILLYGDSMDEAVLKAEQAAREIIADRIAHGELPAEAANPEFGRDWTCQTRKI